jgi:hypothetical protein
MSARLSPATLIALTIPPLLWASNAIIGRFSVAGAHPLVSPILLNSLRWLVALMVLWAIVAWQRARGEPESAQLKRLDWQHWRVYAVLGLLSVASYNTLQYQALRGSTAINVTLIGASGPLWGLLLGRLFFSEKGTRGAWIGGGVSLLGVLVVLAAGDLRRLLALQLALGDVYMLIATLAWSLYSWILRRNRPAGSTISLLLGQTFWGVLLAQPLAALEWAGGGSILQPGWATLGVILWVGIGPSLVAYWCWDVGVTRAGPVLPLFFSNLTPLFAALMSAALLGEPPQAYHVIAFALIVGGILLSRRRA